jgi:predicted PurR-regulated permease PerM
MLHRPTTAPIWSPLRWLGERRAALAGPLSGLLRYVIIAALLTAVGIAYLWQVNSLSNTYEATLKLERQARDLEQQNWLLAGQLAQWSSPAYVDRLSAEQGYVAASVTTLSEPLIASAPSSAAAAGQ